MFLIDVVVISYRKRKRTRLQCAVLNGEDWSPVYPQDHSRDFNSFDTSVRSKFTLRETRRPVYGLPLPGNVNELSLNTKIACLKSITDVIILCSVIIMSDGKWIAVLHFLGHGLQKSIELRFNTRSEVNYNAVNRILFLFFLIEI